MQFVGLIIDDIYDASSLSVESVVYEILSHCIVNCDIGIIYYV